ncbi:ABC transporter permease [Nonomuraea glycinis]|uniref:Nitrate ABC transporter permease n=1 Tax=Nonomuraea glycinis TaxID=2047744 RepID=A0A918AAH4_9ACTN|nr:ABC transporter permease [Nonomuraea glycinis]MCA2181244.1 ABC transporter permease [Nonomuraea glycinis]GGP13369.1 nitrate ABC transporter permease [Nonomuraea glycinis]
MTLLKAEDRAPGVGAAASRRTGRGRRTRPLFNVRGLMFAAGLLLLLEALTTWVVKSAYVPRPSQVGAALYTGIVSGDLLADAGQTFATFGAGLLIAIVVAVPVGVLLGASATAFNSVKLIIEFLRPLPSVALIPFGILILGVGDTTTIALTVYAASWPILFNTYYGVRDADPVAVDTARNFGLGRAAVLRRVLLPSAAVNIAAGVRISGAIALVLTVTVEIITSSGGLGYAIVQMQTAIRNADMYAAVFAVGLLGYAINAAVAGLERKIVFWKTDARDGGAGR